MSQLSAPQSLDPALSWVRMGNRTPPPELCGESAPLIYFHVRMHVLRSGDLSSGHRDLSMHSYVTFRMDQQLMPAGLASGAATGKKNAGRYKAWLHKAHRNLIFLSISQAISIRSYRARV